MSEEIYTLLDNHLHRIAAITGAIVKEKEAYVEAVKLHIADLSLARQEIFEIINKMEEEKNGQPERPDSDGTE